MNRAKLDGVARLDTAFLIAALLMAATCGCADSSQSLQVGSAVVTEAVLTWSPADEMPQEYVETISAELGSELHMIFPSETPVSGSTLATFTLSLLVPENDLQAVLYVDIGPQKERLADVSTHLGELPDYVDGEPVTVRGVTGKAVLAPPGAVSYLHWEEDGQCYAAGFFVGEGGPTSLSVAELVDWLNHWWVLP